MLSKNKEYIVDIVDIGQGGVGIGKYEGFTVFVDGGLVQDKIKVKITKSKKNYAVGDMIEIIEKSPFRVARKCSENLRQCGGCQIQELDYQKQLDIKTNEVKQVISRIGKLDDVVIHDTLGMEHPFRYRNKAQFPIQKKDNMPVIGFYKKKSHDLISTDECIIQHEVNDKIIKIIKTYIRAYNVSIYDEKTHKGLLRHVVTKVGFTTGEVMIVLVANGKKLPYLKELASVLKENIPGFKTLVVNVNTQKTNVILGKENIVAYGDGMIRDYIGELVFEISPLSFFQVNPLQTEVLYNKALEYANLGENDTVFDIYCGIGTISLFLAQKAKKVYGIEIVEEAVEAANENAKLNGLTHCEFIAGDVAKTVNSLKERPDIIIVDPPRPGVHKDAIRDISGFGANEIIYISCNPRTLVLDLKGFEAYGYKVEKVKLMDMFPNTPHCETVVKLKK